MACSVNQDNIIQYADKYRMRPVYKGCNLIDRVAGALLFITNRTTRGAVFEQEHYDFVSQVSEEMV